MRILLLHIALLITLLVTLGACSSAGQPPAGAPAPDQTEVTHAVSPPISGQAVSSSAPFFDMEVDRPAPDFTLTNQDGKPCIESPKN